MAQCGKMNKFFIVLIVGATASDHFLDRSLSHHLEPRVKSGLVDASWFENLIKAVADRVSQMGVKHLAIVQKNKQNHHNSKSAHVRPVKFHQLQS